MVGEGGEELTKELFEALREFSSHHGTEVALAVNGEQKVWFKRGKVEG